MRDHPDSDDRPREQDQEGLSTRSLVRRGKAGDHAALIGLFKRLMLRVGRWAHGRLPRGARDAGDTADVVQDATIGAWRRLDDLDLSRPGNLEAYVRQAVYNRIRDEARRIQRRPEVVGLDSAVPGEDPSPLMQLLSADAQEQFRAAFAKLSDVEQLAIVARFHHQYRHDQIAAILGKPSAAAARMTVNRAVHHLRELAR
jgi:RNA polymerase sigma-70 factor (ECF subfamily)